MTELKTETTPPVKTVPPVGAEVERALQHAAAEKARADRIRLVAEMFTLALLSFLLPALLDYRYFLAASTRLLLEALWFFLIGLCFAHIALQWRRIPTAKTIALDLERYLPDSHCEVSTAAQYPKAPDTATTKSSPARLEAELVSALQQRAATHLRKTRSPYRRPLLIASSALALGAALIAVTLSVSPVSRIAVQRLLVPGGAARYTDVEVHPGEATVAIGDTFNVTAHFRGRLPQQAFFEWQKADGQWQAVPLVQIAPDSFAYQLKNMQYDGHYRIRGNDALSPEYPLHVYPPANIANWQIECIPPAYAQLPTRFIDAGNVATLRGSELSWHLVPTIPLKKAKLNFVDPVANIDLIQDTRKNWLGRMILTKDEIYHATLYDKDGHPGRDSIAFQLTAIPDAPPVVEIADIDENITAGAKDKLHFTIQADDDIGLADLKVIYQHPGSPDTVVSQLPGKTFSGRHLTSHPELDLAPFNLQPYDVLIFYAEATDNNTYDGPGVGRSHVFFVTIRPPPNPNPNGGGGGAGGGEQVNLTELERNLISGTARLAEPVSHSVMADFATSQRQVKDYASQLADKIADAPDALAALTGAIDAMDRSAKALDGSDRTTALAQEEKALLDLYQTARLIPPNHPGSPQPGQAELTITLENMAQENAQKTKAATALKDALEKARALEKAQKPLQNGNGDPSTQQNLANQTQGLGQELNAAANGNPGISHSFGETAATAGVQMHTAADALGKSDTASAGQAQGQSLDSLAQLISGLDKALGAANHKSDVSSEEAPPEFEDQLNHYYEKLSHEK